jgi:hypothetical protein
LLVVAQVEAAMAVAVVRVDTSHLLLANPTVEENH